MSNGAVKAVVGLVALALGFAIGWFVHQRVAPAPIAGGVQVVRVGPHANQLSLDPVPISKSAGDLILWVGVTPGTGLVIESEQELFQQQTSQHGRFAMGCHGRVCASGEILSSTAQGRYKYWQIITTPGHPDEIKDGWIIIDR